MAEELWRHSALDLGVQVIGDRFHDLACIPIAEMIEQSLGILTPIDPIAA